MFAILSASFGPIILLKFKEDCFFRKITVLTPKYQRTNGPVKAHLISWPSKAQNKQNLENIW